LETATLEQVPLLLLARVDGKSPAEYIREPGLKDHIRQFAVDLLERPVLTVQEVFKRLSQSLK
jgi:hypothetical protein